MLMRLRIPVVSILFQREELACYVSIANNCSQELTDGCYNKVKVITYQLLLMLHALVQQRAL
jgi:hypothetical protein